MNIFDLFILTMGAAIYHVETNNQSLVLSKNQDWCGTQNPIPTLEENQKGKLLFRNHCAACHAMNMKTPSTGPALGGVRERWEEGDIYSWIRNPAKVIASGNNAYVNELYNDYGSVMQSFPNLTNEEIDDILEYVEAVNLSTDY